MDQRLRNASHLEVIERVAVRSCVRRGAAVDLVLERGRENRSQFVFTMARGREVIFWQSARTAKQARPAVSVPTSRAAGQRLHIFVDTHERYAWSFSQQQATTSKRALPAGDYAVAIDDTIVATGRLGRRLGSLPHPALTVETQCPCRNCGRSSTRGVVKRPTLDVFRTTVVVCPHAVWSSDQRVARGWRGWRSMVSEREVDATLQG